MHEILNLLTLLKLRNPCFILMNVYKYLMLIKLNVSSGNGNYVEGLEE